MTQEGHRVTPQSLTQDRTLNYQLSEPEGLPPELQPPLKTPYRLAQQVDEQTSEGVKLLQAGKWTQIFLFEEVCEHEPCSN